MFKKFLETAEPDELRDMGDAAYGVALAIQAYFKKHKHATMTWEFYNDMVIEMLTMSDDADDLADAIERETAEEVAHIAAERVGLR
jgi:hypothetical protein